MAGVVILTDPPFLGPPDYFDCCEWDPFFHKCFFFFFLQINYFKSLNVWYLSTCQQN